MNEFPSIGRTLSDAAERLADVSESPRLDAEILLTQALDVPRSYLFAHPEEALDADARSRYEKLLTRRADGVPLAYLTGVREFWSMALMVTPATLIPRPETETLVERALSLIGRRAELDVLDLGTGSGAIALAVARERPNCRVTGTDVSTGAIAVAAQNARQLDLPNVTFVCGNWFEPVARHRFDIVLSNPPYVTEADAALAALRHEPQNALVAGADGLDAIRHIAAGAAAVLKPGGRLLMEHGDEQAAAAAEVLAQYGWLEVEHHRDLAGIARVVSARGGSRAG